jgi:hypothetical protein
MMLLLRYCGTASPAARDCQSLSLPAVGDCVVAYASETTTARVQPLEAVALAISVPAATARCPVSVSLETVIAHAAVPVR